jgi:hypothetical protein
VRESRALRVMGRKLETGCGSLRAPLRQFPTLPTAQNTAEKALTSHSFDFVIDIQTPSMDLHGWGLQILDRDALIE